MIRALTILVAVVAAAVAVAPVASAAPSNAKPAGFERGERATAFVWEAELSPVKGASPKAGASNAREGGKMRLEVLSIGAGKDRGW